MSFEQESTVVILSPDETARLGSLDPDIVTIIETRELYNFREIDITVQLTDEHDDNISKYWDLLIAGNKIWRPKTSDNDSCLYVITGPKKPDWKNNSLTVTAIEEAVELGEYSINYRGSGTWNISTFLDGYSALISKGTVTATGTAKYDGAYTALSAFNKIQDQIAGEFRFMYVYDTVNKYVKRYIDFLTEIGTTHETVIEMGYNTDNINLIIDESDVAIAAGPVGEPSDAASNFHESRAAFEAQAFITSEQIPLFVTKDDNGNDVNGPMVYPPYPKPAGQKYVECNNSSELVASYQRIYKQRSSGSGSYPRIYTFDSSEEDKYNLYWLCVDNLRQHLQPRVNISCNVIDLKKLEGAESENYCVGDRVYVRLPGFEQVVECRITRTTKNQRTPELDSIEMSSHKTSFMKLFFKRLKSPGSILIS